MSRDLIVYLKTTDSCQLNCDHCFTSGSNGKKGWFDVPQTIRFFRELKRVRPDFTAGHFSFHGGEPMLAPTALLFEAWNGIKDLWPALWWTVQTNLTYSLTDDKLRVFNEICGKSWGTSWDFGIRWKTPRQQALWEDNVRQLARDGHDITVMVSLNRKLVENYEPIEIIEELSELGVRHVNFERITPNGNALAHRAIFPDNRELDQWFLKMWHQSVEHRAWEKIDNMFLDSILTSLVYNTYSGCRSRQCEQKILTINADGTVGGCPNDAPSKHFGTIHDPIEKILYSPCRLCNIQRESMRHDACATCPVHHICNGDCHQLEWQGDACPAPKSLMTLLATNPDTGLYKQMMNGFMGQE